MKVISGYCNICESYGPLTADHVPPKGASTLYGAETKTLAAHLSGESQRPLFHQNGVKFPTLCQKCNNERLGGQYDPALIGLSRRVGTIVRARHVLTLPSEITVSAVVQRVARAIMGHLLAFLPRAEFGTPVIHAPFPDAMRKYFLDPSSPLPLELTIYYWTYLADEHVVVRGFGLKVPQSSDWIVSDVIKFPPLAYWVVWEKPTGVKIGLPSLIVNRSCGIDDEQQVHIRLRNIPSPEWPERPGTGMNLVNEGMTLVARRRQR